MCSVDCDFILYCTLIFIIMEEYVCWEDILLWYFTLVNFVKRVLYLMEIQCSTWTKVDSKPSGYV